MCGIAGTFAYHDSAPPVDAAELLRVRDAMLTRGPDGAGLWTSADNRVGLAHRRLAIIDLSDAGAQPMSTLDGRLRITFNGEIYNYRELKKELEAKGYRFQSNCDTEVLLHLYAERGPDMVHALQGMYAFGIWDEREQALFLARDPFGIKPLYIADDGRSLRFASQVKALVKGGGADTAPEPAGSVGFLIWGHVPEPYTLYRGIRSVPAGAYLQVSRRGDVRITKFFDIAEEFRRAEHAPPAEVREAADVLGAALRGSVRRHLVSDVPVGLFLSAGIDSSVLAGLSAEEGTALRAVTLGFPEYQGTSEDEVPTAAMVAARLGMHHEVHWITRADFDAELDRILDVMDQPTIDGVNTYFVSRAAARAGMKVAFSGVGGDELFGGYPSFTQIPRVAASLRFARHIPVAGRLARRVFAPLAGALTSSKYAGLLEYGGSYEGAYLLRRTLFMPWEVKSVLDPATAKRGLEELRSIDHLQATIEGLRQPRSRVSALEIAWYMRNQLLRDADWAGMAHSLEIRVPLVDLQLFRSLAPLIVSERYPTKRDFAGALNTPAPAAVLNRPKSGFTTPVRQWIGHSSGDPSGARGLRDWAKRVLPAQPRNMRALVLVTDAFDGVGGIAKFNRDFVTSLAGMPEFSEVVVVPRLAGAASDKIPAGVKFVRGAAGSKLRFLRSSVWEAVRARNDLIICGHINLAPVSAGLSLLSRSPSVLVVHGVDAWTRSGGPVRRLSLPRFTLYAGVSRLTLDRFSSWSNVEPRRLRLLPNCVDVNRFVPGEKSQALAEKLGLLGRTVIMTMGRLCSEERYKGFDEIIESLPELARVVPNVSYLVCGDGSDRARLEEKAESLSVRNRVVFTGFVPEDGKADHYRLADAYVMPSRGEGFGIVLLEALACGIPVLGSRADGTREALLDGKLGLLVDPSNPEEIREGVLKVLRAGRRGVHADLAYYSDAAFSTRSQALVREALDERKGGRAIRVRAADHAPNQ